MQLKRNQGGKMFPFQHNHSEYDARNSTFLSRLRCALKNKEKNKYCFMYNESSFAHHCHWGEKKHSTHRFIFIIKI